MSTSSVLGRDFLRAMTSSKRITSDDFISSSACISTSASTGILSGVYRRGVLKDDRVFPSRSGIVRRVFVDRAVGGVDHHPSSYECFVVGRPSVVHPTMQGNQLWFWKAVHPGRFVP